MPSTLSLQAPLPAPRPSTAAANLYLHGGPETKAYAGRTETEVRNQVAALLPHVAKFSHPSRVWRFKVLVASAISAKAPRANILRA